MSAPTNLMDAWETYAADQPQDISKRQLMLMKRAAYYLATAALAMQGRGVQREALLSEGIAFGRTVGTAAEAA